MTEISHENRLEVAMLYLRGNTYKEIETKTGLSHGSISNIVNKLLSGQLVIPGVPSDEVSDLHQLSVDLKKKNLEPSQALLGFTLFEKFKELGIVPSQFDQWSKLVKVCVPDDFPAKDFFEAALNLSIMNLSCFPKSAAKVYCWVVCCPHNLRAVHVNC